LQKGTGDAPRVGSSTAVNDNHGILIKFDEETRQSPKINLTANEQSAMHGTHSVALLLALFKKGKATRIDSFNGNQNHVSYESYFLFRITQNLNTLHQNHTGFISNF